MYERDFRAYLDFARDRAMEPVMLARWVTHLSLNTIMSPNTINRMVSAVKKIMKVAAALDYIAHEDAEALRHVDGVKVSALKDRKRINNRVRIDPPTMRLLIDSIDRSQLSGLRNAAFFTTLSSSGLRIHELTLLKQQQVIQRDGKYLLVMYAEVGKNQNEDRDAHISEEAVEAIRAWILARPVQSEYIFTSFEGRGNRPLAKPISPQGAWLLVKDVAEPFVPGVKPHDFRRFVGTRLAKKDLHMAQLALGHKNIESTVKYDLREIEAGATDNLY
jgi:integrase